MLSIPTKVYDAVNMESNGGFLAFVEFVEVIPRLSYIN